MTPLAIELRYSHLISVRKIQSMTEMKVDKLLMSQCTIKLQGPLQPLYS